MMGGLGIVAGEGDLPRLLAMHCAASKRPYHVVVLDHTPLDWVGGHPIIPARMEQISKLCADLHAIGCETLVFAGGMLRPTIDPSALDQLGQQLAFAVLGVMKKGDDQTLRFVIELFEGQGFDVVGAAKILPDLVPELGNIASRSPTEIEVADANLARTLVTELGKLDVGQGAVVAGGLCLGLETIQGTDLMLEFVASTRPNSGGVLVKALKPEQDIRIDMPVIGVETVNKVAKAGLNGIAIQAGGAMIINRSDVVAAADAAGVTIWTTE